MANFKVVEQTKGIFYHFYVIVNQGRLFKQLKTIYLLCHFWTLIVNGLKLETLTK